MLINATVSASGAETATINVVSRSELQIAPEAVYFDVSLSGFDSTGPGAGEVWDDRLHEVYYYWDFYATGSDSDESYTFQHLTKTPTAFRTSRTASGPRISHTYRVPGTYRVSCLAVEPASGKSATATLDVTIGDPDIDVFTADNQTIIIGSAWATYPNATVVATMAAAVSNIAGFADGTTPRRVIVRRGQTLSSSGFNVGDGATWPSTHWVAADEAGADPIFDMTGAMRWDNGGTAADKDLTFQNLTFRGGWDTTTETGTKVNGIEVSRLPPKQMLFDNVILRDCGERTVQTIETDMATHPYRIYFNDCFIDGWRKYGMYLSSAALMSLTGTKIEQDPLANVGGPDNGNYNYSTPFRFTLAGALSTGIIHSSEIFSRTGWTSRGDIYGAQACVRFDTAGVGGGTFLIHRSVLESGQEQITLGADGGKTNKRINGLFAQNYMLGSHITIRSVNNEKAGTTYRNNIIVIPDTTEFLSEGAGYRANYFFRYSPDKPTTGELGAPIRFYNNTLINLLTHSVDEAATSGGFTDTEVDINNAIYEPNLGSPNTADGPFSTTSLFTPSELGYKHNVNLGTGHDVLETAYATPATSVWECTPSGGAGVLGDATTGTIAYDDFYGNVRPATKDRGAIQVST